MVHLPLSHFRLPGQHRRPAGVEEAASGARMEPPVFSAVRVNWNRLPLALHLVEAVTRTGVLVIPCPRSCAVPQWNNRWNKALRQSAAAYKENIILLDTRRDQDDGTVFGLNSCAFDGFERAVYRS